jgi:PAS domain S-box-containing protein
MLQFLSSRLRTGAQLRALLRAMDRLNTGDTEVEIPYLGHPTEAGRVAATLEACRRGMIAAASERRRAEQANAAVRDGEARYRMLADNTVDIIIHYDLEFRPLYISPSVKNLGYQADALLSGQLEMLVHPDDRAAVAARRVAATAGEPVKPLSARLRTADGAWRWVEGTLTPLIDAAGKRVGFVSTVRDIDERKLAEQALIESEARYRMLAENISDVMLRYDSAQHIEYVSPSVSQWGYAPADFIGKPAGHFVHPEDQARIAARRTAMLQGEAAPTVEARIIRADGKWTWIESNAAVIRGDDGAILGVVVTMRDINQRKMAEAALIESEVRYRMLADNTSDIIQRFDADGVVQYISPSVRQLGYEPEFFLGRPTAQLVSPEDLPDVVRRRRDLLSGRPVPPLESRVHAADGRAVWLESRPSPILDDHGKLLGVVNVMRDVTDRKAAESALQDLNLELRRVARASALGAFAASLAHEINQPLAAAAVNGEAALRWLSAEPVNYDRGLQATRRAVEAVRRAADVIGRLRALVTKEEPNRAPFDAHEAIVEVLALTALEAERSSVKVAVRLEARKAQVLGDRVQFQQVMINLILNAIEAMRDQEGERLLQIGSRDGPEELELSVEDCGPGIAPDKQPLIFESMFTTKIGGTGLGLAIAKSIVESHGGAIAMTPASPHGAVFKVQLPKAPDEAGARRRRPAVAENQ